MIFKIAFFIIHCAWFCSDGFVVATKPRKEKNGNVDLERLNLRRLVDESEGENDDDLEWKFMWLQMRTMIVRIVIEKVTTMMERIKL
jgi:hypothetical protein